MTGSRPVGSIAALPDVRGAMLFSGKKTEVLLLDSLTVNRAQNVSREVLGRIPGANFSETEGSGFPSNGIGWRGLDPVQSVELNVRQDGVGIAADVFGYPETYYLPPLEAVSRVEVVRGAGSLQFGPQVGGVINYVLREGTPNTAPQVTARETAGSYGLSTTYGDVSGGAGRWTYFAYAQGRTQDGSRPNGDMRQLSGSGRVGYQASDALRLTVDYSLLRNRIHMPGGLGNEAFDEDPRQSLRSRNWLTSPWNVGSLTADWRLTPLAHVVTTLSGMVGARALVWRNEDGGADAPDAIDPSTGLPVPREVDHEAFRNVTLESRFLSGYPLFGRYHTLAAGFRLYDGTMARDEGGIGSQGSGFNLALQPGTAYAQQYRFRTQNAALFAESAFHLGERFTLTPGARLEWLASSGTGHAPNAEGVDSAANFSTRRRSFPLFGIGAQWRTSATTNAYANVTGAYRPVDYSTLVPFGSAIRVASNLRDSRATSVDAGVRGTWRDLVTFDVGAFRMVYGDRIGLVTVTDPDGTSYTERRNVATSLHYGAESFVELRPLNRVLGFGDALTDALGTFGMYDSFAYVHATYTGGGFAGNRVEYAPRVIDRVGLTWRRGPVDATAQFSTVSGQFGDANNTVASYDASVGIVPAYQLVDVSGSWRVRPRTAITFGVNNVQNVAYFTRRTAEYPGPGIIPGQGRSVYLGLAYATVPGRAR
ncbi:MAG TPA: TonB-dependent receptor [Gemmatirosa sp.]